jgi:hypothetical protein
MAHTSRRGDGSCQFLEFFGATPEVGEMMGEAGMTERPTPLFWSELDTPDGF